MQLDEDTIIKGLWGALVAALVFLWNLARGEHYKIKQKLEHLEDTKVSKGDLDSLKMMVVDSITSAERRASELRTQVEATRKESRDSASRGFEKVETALSELDRKITQQGQNILSLARERGGKDYE